MTVDRPTIPVEAARAILINPESSATALFCLVLNLYQEQSGTNLLESEDPPEPVEVWQDLEEAYGVTIPLVNENRMNALWLGLSGDGFFEEPEIFRAVCEALFDGDIGDPLDAMTDELGIEEIIWGSYEMSIWLDGLPPFDPRIQQLIDQAGARDALDGSEGAMIGRMVAGLSEDLTTLGLSAEELQQFLMRDHERMGQERETPAAAAGPAGLAAPGGYAGT